MPSMFVGKRLDVLEIALSDEQKPSALHTRHASPPRSSGYVSECTCRSDHVMPRDLEACLHSKSRGRRSHLAWCEGIVQHTTCLRMNMTSRICEYFTTVPTQASPQSLQQLVQRPQFTSKVPMPALPVSPICLLTVYSFLLVPER